MRHCHVYQRVRVSSHKIGPTIKTPSPISLQSPLSVVFRVFVAYSQVFSMCFSWNQGQLKTHQFEFQVTCSEDSLGWSRLSWSWNQDQHLRRSSRKHIECHWNQPSRFEGIVQYSVLSQFNVVRTRGLDTGIVSQENRRWWGSGV